MDYYGISVQNVETHPIYVLMRGVAMNAISKKSQPAIAKSQEKGKAAPGIASQKRRVLRERRERVLVEFPVRLLERADDAATKLAKNRSELIRTAVEQMLDEMEKKKFEMELAAAYTANAQMNLELAEEFSHVDKEGF